MPTSQRRIAVIQDPALSEAVERARPRLGAGRSTASIIRELALRGARDLEDEAETQRRAAGELMKIMRAPGVMEWDVLDDLQRRDSEPR